MDQFKAVIAYDGTDYLGFQVQAQGRTVQGVIETALQKIAKQPIRVIAAGRTDTGVHATGQVIAFRLPWRHTVDTLQKALNVNLPQDVVVSHLTKTDGDFHPRFDAIERQYRYLILNRKYRDVFLQRYAMIVSDPLSISDMQEAAEYLIGEHDFLSFGTPPQGINSVRTVKQAQWSVSGEEMVFEITANAFLYRMVRNIVGALSYVGLGKLKADDIKALLLAKDRSIAPPPAIPNGLTLVKVTYPSKDQNTLF